MQRYNDEMVDIAIKYAGYEMLADAACVSADACSDTSAQFDSRIEALIRRKTAGRHAKTALKIAARVAAILAIVIVISTAVICSSEALRVQVMNMLYVEKEDFTEIHFSDAQGVQTPEGMVVPEFIPYGFTLIEVQDEGEGIMIMSLYENEAGDMIRIQQLPVSSSIGVDNDNAYETQIAGRTVYVSESEQENIVVFSNDWNCFIINGMAPVNDLLAMTESMLE